MWSMLRSLCLLGMFVAESAQAVAARAASLDATIPSRNWQSETAELPGGLQLALATSDQAVRVACCLGLTVQRAARDPSLQLASVADLELRRSHLSSLVRGRDASDRARWHALDLTLGDATLLCLNVPADAVDQALDTLLEGLRPMVLNQDRIQMMLRRWQNHEGLAQLDESNSIHQEAEMLAWLGVPDATFSLSHLAQRLGAQRFDNWHTISASVPHAISLTIAGDYDKRRVESLVRANRWLRQYAYYARANRIGPERPIRQSVFSYPRFARISDPQRDYHAWVFTWPVAPLDDLHAMGLRVIAALGEERLNRAFASPDGESATCEAIVYRGFGSLQIEIRSYHPLEFTQVEQRVLGVVEQLRSNPVSEPDLRRAADQSQVSYVASSDDALTQAVELAQLSFLSKKAKPAAARVTSADIQRWAKLDLGKEHRSELVSEAIPKPPKHEPSRVRAYWVKRGESLQSIALKFHVSVADLIRANRLRHPSQLVPGMKLLVPNVSASASTR